MDATSLLEDVLLKPTPTHVINPTPTTTVAFQNIQSSSHACYRHFLHGHNMGTFKSTDPSVQAYPDRLGQYLMPDSGMIMSSGNPDDFCGNDSDQSTKNWYEVGDETLTGVIQQSNPFAQTYDGTWSFLYIPYSLCTVHILSCVQFIPHVFSFYSHAISKI